jgi:hypothetical protein
LRAEEGEMQPRQVYACDIGSTRHERSKDPKFAWVRVTPDRSPIAIGSHSIESLVNYLGKDLRAGFSIAIGFEAPLFFPVPIRSDKLSKARQGEGDRPFSAQIGLAVAALALHQTAWILVKLKEAPQLDCQFTLDYQDWPPPPGRQVIFCWEAFVSGPAHSDTDLADAATAAMEFCLHEGSLASANAIEKVERPFSLIGAAALWSGWVEDVQFLHKPTLVIKPEAPHSVSLGAPLTFVGDDRFKV